MVTVTCNVVMLCNGVTSYHYESNCYIISIFAIALCSIEIGLFFQLNHLRRINTKIIYLCAYQTKYAILGILGCRPISGPVRIRVAAGRINAETKSASIIYVIVYNHLITVVFHAKLCYSTYDWISCSSDIGGPGFYLLRMYRIRVFYSPMFRIHDLFLKTSTQMIIIQ